MAEPPAHGDNDGFGQQEPTMGRWAQKREARRQMYLASTERTVIGERRVKGGPRAAASSGTSHAICQKCLQKGHWTYMCKNPPVYAKRASRTQILKRPDLYKREPKEEKPPEITDLEQEVAELENNKKIVAELMESSASSSDESSDSSSSDSSSSSGSSSDSSSSSSDSSSSVSSSDSDTDAAPPSPRISGIPRRRSPSSPRKNPSREFLSERDADSRKNGPVRRSPMSRPPRRKRSFSRSPSRHQGRSPSDRRNDSRRQRRQNPESAEPVHHGRP